MRRGYVIEIYLSVDALTAFETTRFLSEGGRVISRASRNYLGNERWLHKVVPYPTYGAMKVWIC